VSNRAEILARLVVASKHAGAVAEEHRALWVRCLEVKTACEAADQAVAGILAELEADAPETPATEGTTP
jgi:hypothetical protein